MLSDERATQVMVDLEYIDVPGSGWEALFQHLYEMHKIRDAFMFRHLGFVFLYQYPELATAFREMQYDY